MWVLLVAGLGPAQGLNWYLLIIRWSQGLLEEVVACPVEAEWGGVDTVFCMVRRGGDLVAHSFGCLVKLKAAVLRCAQRIRTLNETSLRSRRWRGETPGWVTFGV